LELAAWIQFLAKWLVSPYKSVNRSRPFAAANRAHFNACEWA
jgi:hypothetical protein